MSEHQYTLGQAKEIMRGCDSFIDIEYIHSDEVKVDGDFTPDQLRLIAWIKENSPEWMNEL